MTDWQHDSADRVAEILERRAGRLARPPAEPEPNDALEVLVMAFGSERYGLTTGTATEILTSVTATPVPGAPRSWQGIVNVRGTLYPVLDLRTHLSLGASEEPVATPGVVLVTTGSGLTVGIALEQPPELLQIRRSSLRPGANGVGGPGGPRVATGTVTDELVTLVDLELLLADSRLVDPEALA